MNLGLLLCAAFEDELEKIAIPGELRPNTALTTAAPRMATIKLAPGSKIAATRAVKEWQASQAAGDQGTADSIAKGYGQLGLKPRQLKDVSTGGEEAGVDLMMGRKAVPSTGEVNESGYVARKLYKPDSAISRGDYTNQLLGQKQQVTDAARAMSPEAKQMVPAMYGHETMGQGGLQRNVSYHEYVPSISDLRGTKQEVNGRDTYSRPRNDAFGDVGKVEQTVLDPMKAKGMTLGDTVRSKTTGGKGVNWGNVVNSPQGPKVLDFLPSVQGQQNPAYESFKAHFGADPTKAPAYGGSQFSGDNANVGSLRKEVFKPTMDMTPKMQPTAPARPAPVTSSAADSIATSAPRRPAPAASGVSEMRTAPTNVPAARAATPAPAMGALRTAPTAPIPLVRPHIPAAPMAAAGGMLQRAEHSVAAKAPGMLTRIGKFLK